MALEFKVPELGENVEKGDVVRVMVKAGDVLKVDQPVFELETDKATIEVPSTIAGTITDVRIKQGDKVKPGQVVLTVTEVLGSGSPEVRKSAEPSPQVGAPGLQPRGTAAVVNIESARPAPAPAPVAAREPVAPLEPAGSVVPAAPSVRRFARELGIDIAQVAGTGPGGRIGQEDVKAYV
jgi:pyruvate dehydrogenase E2 component (dihydrolipoamide acetyltransferase)